MDDGTNDLREGTPQQIAERRRIREILTASTTKGSSASRKSARSGYRWAWAWLIFVEVFGLLYATDIRFLGGLATLPIFLIWSALSGHLTWDVASQLPGRIALEAHYSLLAALMGRGSLKMAVFWGLGPVFALPFYPYGIWVFLRKKPESRKGLSNSKATLGLYLMCLLSYFLSMFILYS